MEPGASLPSLSPVPLRPAVVAGFSPFDADAAEVPPRHLRDYIRILYKYRWLALASFALTAGVMLLWTLATPRAWSAATRVQLSRSSPIKLRLDENVLRVDDNNPNTNGTSTFLATQVTMLKSRDLAERVIRGEHLAENEAFLDPSAERRGLLSLSGRLLSSLRPRGWDAGAPSGSAQEVSGSADIDGTLIDRYTRWLSVQELRGTDLVEIRFTTPSPYLSAFLASAHTRAFLEANEEARLATDVTAKEFLGRQIRESEDRVARSEGALNEFAAQHPGVAIDQEQKVVAQRLADLSTALTKSEAARVGLQSRYAFLTGDDGDPGAYFLDQPGIQKLHGTLLEIRAQRAAWAERLGPNHPQMAELARHESEVSSQLRAEVQREVAGVRAKWEAAREKEQGLRAQLAEQERGSVAERELGARYALLRGEVDNAHTLHDSLLKQQLETAVNAELGASNVRIVERAEVPLRPSTPNVPLNLVLALVAGALAAAAAAFGCEYFDSSVKSGDEVEGLLQLPTLATIPNFQLARRAAYSGKAPLAGPAEIVVLTEPRSPVAEAFRTLRTALLFSTAAAPPKVVLLTSASASEGKTVSSLNLASTLAESGARVLLVDVDLRRPSCHVRLGTDNLRGLSNFLAGQASLEDVTLALPSPRLDFIPAGPLPPNPAELIGSPRMRDALATLRERYDFVILDTPPVLPVTDTLLLARDVDGAVLVVKGHDTPRDLVRRARDLLVRASVPLLGVVVNNVDLGWGDLYFYQRYYGAYGAAEAA